MEPNIIKKDIFTKETVLAIVETLTGNIKPVGDSGKDAESLENLKLLCEVVDGLVMKISDISTDNIWAYEASVIRSKEYAANFITQLKETYPLQF